MEIKQTGLLVRPPNIKDYIAGANTGIIYEERIADGNWLDFLPTGEKQYAVGFDSMSCVSFSALNSLEAQFAWLIKNKKLSVAQMNFLSENGYLDADGKVNFSDRFTAIMSGTMRNGNYFTNVWDSIRRDGLLPERDFPMGGNNWDEYHDKTKITEAMKAKAKKILEHFLFQYEWVFYSEDPTFNDPKYNAAASALKQAPIQIGMPMPASHAIIAYRLVYKKEIHTFDQYPDFKFQLNNNGDPWNGLIHFAMKGLVTPKKEQAVMFNFTKKLFSGMTDPEVRTLQQFLNTDPETAVAKIGIGSKGKESDYFGALTTKAVKRFQTKYGLVSDGIFGKLSIAKAVEVQKKN